MNALNEVGRRVNATLGVHGLRRNEMQPQTECYQSKKAGEKMQELAGTTGLEPATSDVTGRRSNQLNYVPARVGTVSS